MGNLLKIYTVNDKKEYDFLRKKSVEVSLEELKSKEFQSFLDDLIYTAKNVVTEEGYIAAGLAAIQVGKEKRVFCILKEDTREFEIMVNPIVDILKPEQVIGLDACLSIPRTEGKVSRFSKIRVTYLDREGKEIRKNFTGFESREIQHEYDHLDGILFTDKLVD